MYVTMGAYLHSSFNFDSCMCIDYSECSDVYKVSQFQFLRSMYKPIILS